MPRFDDKHVKICGCYIVWDGITRPGSRPDGSTQYSLKLVIEPNNPDLVLFQQIAQATLQQSEFQGVLPAGGLMPVGTAAATEFNGVFNGWAVVSAKSSYVPDIYDEAGTLLDPMQYTPMMYVGQRVDALLHCYSYNKAGNRGVSTGLDAFAIIVSANAPRQDFGGGGIATAAAFGAPAAQITGQAQPGMIHPQATPAPVATSGYAVPAATPAPVAQTQYAPPTAPGAPYPQQATGFMPPKPGQ